MIQEICTCDFCGKVASKKSELIKIAVIGRSAADVGMEMGPHGITAFCLIERMWDICQCCYNKNLANLSAIQTKGEE